MSEKITTVKITFLPKNLYLATTYAAQVDVNTVTKVPTSNVYLPLLGNLDGGITPDFSSAALTIVSYSLASMSRST